MSLAKRPRTTFAHFRHICLITIPQRGFLISATPSLPSKPTRFSAKCYLCVTCADLQVVSSAHGEET